MPPAQSAYCRRTIGFAAAAALHRLIGGEAEIPPLLVGPVRVVTRQSSDTLAIEVAEDQ